MIKKVFAGLLLISATCIVSCKPKDAEIQTRVSESVTDDDVDVSVKDGVVTLSGEVKSSAAKAKAEVEARKVKDIQTVENNITVLPPPPPPVLVPGDAALDAHVQVAISPFKDVRASVNNGVVTLTGEIHRPELLLLMPAIAVLHPKGIENNMKVK